MKKICIIFLLSIIISLTALGFGGFSENGAPMYALSAQNQEISDEYLRIHIRADSNEDRAQAVKYKVRDGVVDYLTPLVADYTTQRDAVQGIAKNLEGIRLIAEEILRAAGFTYGAVVEIKTENFPTRVYGSYT